MFFPTSPSPPSGMMRSVSLTARSVRAKVPGGRASLGAYARRAALVLNVLEDTLSEVSRQRRSVAREMWLATSRSGGSLISVWVPGVRA